MNRHLVVHRESATNICGNRGKVNPGLYFLTFCMPATGIFHCRPPPHKISALVWGRGKLSYQPTLTANGTYWQINNVKDIEKVATLGIVHDWDFTTPRHRVRSSLTFTCSFWWLTNCLLSAALSNPFLFLSEVGSSVFERCSHTGKARWHRFT